MRCCKCCHETVTLAMLIRAPLLRRGLMSLGGRALYPARHAGRKVQDVATRSVFTYPAPRKLSDIMKVPLVRRCQPWEIEEMWQEYHRERHDAMAKSIPAQQFQLLKDRAKPCKNFIFPVYRDSGYMMVISQFQDMCFLLTYLEEYRKNPAAANPWMSVTLYDEFIPDKGIGLLRGDVSNQLTKKEGSWLIDQLVDAYTHSEKYRTVWQFNNDARNFSFDRYIRSVPRPLDYTKTKPTKL